MNNRFSLLTLGLLIAHGTASAATISVPADQATIQAAIDIAADGDVISVAAGTYVENINFAGKAIAVESVDGPATTIIDGDALASVVVFVQSETRDSIIRGFTITNGSANEGGGIFASGSSPTIEDNIISGNTACTGGGIGLGFAAPLIQNNQIVSNGTAGGGCTGSGGGISIRGSSRPEIYDNLIASNVASSGAAFYLFASGFPTIARNEISGNQASGNGGAFTMYNSSNVLIINNIIHDNSADDGSAFWWLIPTSAPNIRFNTIFGNSAANGATIHADGFDGAGAITSNIIVAPAGQTAIFCGTSNDLNNPALEANNVLAPGGVLYGGNCADQTGVSGNLSTDSNFADAANGDFRLIAGSLMVDAALEDAAVTVDFLMNARAVDGNADLAAVSDIGAYEATPPVAIAGADVAVAANSAGSLDGSGSSDADGAISAYRWLQTSGTAVTLSNSQNAAPTFTTPNAAATLVFELMVTDDLGYQATDEVRISVAAPPAPRPSGGGGGSLDLITLGFLLAGLGVVGLLRRKKSLHRSEYECAVFCCLQ